MSDRRFIVGELFPHKETVRIYDDQVIAEIDTERYIEFFLKHGHRIRLYRETFEIEKGEF